MSSHTDTQVKVFDDDRARYIAELAARPSRQTFKTLLLLLLLRRPILSGFLGFSFSRACLGCVGRSRCGLTSLSKVHGTWLAFFLNNTSRRHSASLQDARRQQRQLREQLNDARQRETALHEHVSELEATHSETLQARLPSDSCQFLSSVPSVF